MCESTRFIVREIIGSSRLSRYRLRQGDLVIHLRHGSPDILNLDEIFYRRLYELQLEDARGAARP